MARLPWDDIFFEVSVAANDLQTGRTETPIRDIFWYYENQDEEKVWSRGAKGEYFAGAVVVHKVDK